MARRISGEKVRFGIVGVGCMGLGHCDNIKIVEEAELTAICDIEQAKAEKVGHDYGVPFFFKHQDLIKSGLCDAIIVATPHPSHPEIAINAMRAGLHVLCEKPLSERVSTADAMIATAKETDMVLGVMLQMRMRPVFAKAIQIVQSGLLGRIYRVTMICTSFRTQAYYNSGGWRATWSGEGGGVMMNQAPHNLDLFYLLGGKPETIHARTETRLHDIEVEDLAEAMLTYPGGGTGYFYCTTNESGPGDMMEVFGDKGKLCYRDNTLRYFRFEPGVKEFIDSTLEMWGKPELIEEPLEIEDRDAGRVPVIRNFARHLLHGEPLNAPAEDAIHSLELANGAWLSAHQKRVIEFPVSRADYDEFLEMKRQTSTFVKRVDDRVHAVTDPSNARMLEKAKKQ